MLIGSKISCKIVSLGNIKNTVFWDVAATCSSWFLARGFFYPEDGGDTFLRNVGSPKFKRRNIPEDGILLSHRCENLKSCIGNIKLYVIIPVQLKAKFESDSKFCFALLTILILQLH
jgi:hypothetical protein